MAFAQISHGMIAMISKWGMAAFWLLVAVCGIALALFGLSVGIQFIRSEEMPDSIDTVEQLTSFLQANPAQVLRRFHIEPQEDHHPEIPVEVTFFPKPNMKDELVERFRNIVEKKVSFELKIEVVYS